MAYQDELRTKYISVAGVKSPMLCDIFASLFAHYSNHPGYSRIAYWTGSIANTTGGIGYFSQPRRFGEQAWGVWRTVSASVPYDIAIKYSADQTYGSTGGQWKSVNDTGISFIICHNSGGFPWNGTTGNTGDDSFTEGATQPWREDSHTGLRSNGSDGVDATNRNGMIEFINNGNYTDVASLLITSDYNNTFICVNPVRIPNLAFVSTCMFFGTYQPLTASTTANVFQVHFNETPFNTTDYGAPSVRTGGGIVYTGSATPGVRVAKLDMQNIGGAGVVDYGYFNPYAPGKITEYPILVYTTESTYRSLGRINPDFLRYTNTSAYHFKQYNTGSRMTVYSNIANYTFTVAIQTGTIETEVPGR